MSYACESCGLQLRIVKKTKKVTTYEKCPRCELYNAGVAAQRAAAMHIATAKTGKKAVSLAYLNEYGIFAEIRNGEGHIEFVKVGTSQEAEPFVALTSKCLDVQAFARFTESKELPHV